ncbi:hypothetical protein LY76DRAFT_381219 [Colletotrichum caudatum]|nr:hypothetical protein LY76DRAFT_381219 [Colletotrichum caudatum]
MYSTMTFEEMSKHKGGELYETPMLKPKSWKNMYATMINRSYWTSFVIRSKAGIVNTMMSRLGLATPYGVMRLSTMLGTVVTTTNGMFSIKSPSVPILPVVPTPPYVSKVVCSSAMTKLTKIMYQKGIDLSKHGRDMSKIAAIETLMKATDTCYAMLMTDEGVGPAMCNTMHAIARGEMGTSLINIASLDGHMDVLTRSILVVSMIETVDSVTLTDSERIAAGFLLPFLSKNVPSVIYIHGHGRAHVLAQSRLVHLGYVLGHQVDQERDERPVQVPGYRHVHGHQLDPSLDSDREHEHDAEQGLDQGLQRDGGLGHVRDLDHVLGPATTTTTWATP